MANTITPKQRLDYAFQLFASDNEYTKSKDLFKDVDTIITAGGFTVEPDKEPVDHQMD